MSFFYEIRAPTTPSSSGQAATPTVRPLRKRPAPTPRD